MTKAAPPAKRFHLGSIRLSVWANTDRFGKPYYTTTIGRSYKDDSGKWSDSGSLRPSDLPVVRDLSAKALDWITAHPPAQAEDAGDPEPEPDPKLAALLAMIENQFTR